MNTILLDIYPKVTTRKLLVVGHSQGGMYANKLYEYLIGHGEPKTALGVYAVGTADSYVAGGGKYLTYNLDPVINKVRYLTDLNPLPGNIDLVDLSPDVPVEGHSFIDQYLAGAGDRIVSDIQGELSALKPDAGTSAEGCFTPPTIDGAYKVEQAILAVADPTASTIRDGAVAGYQGTKTVAIAVGTSMQKSYSSVASAIGSIKNLFSVNLGTKEQDEATFQVAKALYGSSLDTADIQAIIDGKDLGSAVMLATKPVLKKEEKAPGLVLGAHTDTASSSLPSPIKTKKKGTAFHGGTLIASESLSVSEEPAPEEEIPPMPQETASSTEATSTPPAEEATSTEPVFYVMASQSDESNLCAPNWRACYTGSDAPAQTRIDLGQGSGLGGGKIISLTIAKDENSLFKYPWVITIECWVDIAHTQPCPDWTAPSSWNGQQTSVLAEFAMPTPSDRYWTAYFTDSVHDRAFDGSSPATFNPNYYYTLLINDDGWHFGAYGSATEPYWVLTGQK
ncbi:MAG TPA: hypothetical protein VHD55_02650 [Candidatus Paceibacterota bacterium]|nr:hypothetical protein [Candidatus Paceibacterota bacterium]